MELVRKKTKIKGGQILLVMFVSRIGFATLYIPALNAGNSIQDIILSVPIAFFINLLLAIPLLMLLRRKPESDPVYSAGETCGKPVGVLFGLFYCLSFLLMATVLVSGFVGFYNSSISSDTQTLAIVLPMLLAVIYGAIKGIETFARFGLFVFLAQVAVLSILILALLPNAQMDYLKRMFYNGGGLQFKSVIANVNTSFQIIMLSMSAPFLKESEKPVKTFILWDVAAMGVFFIEQISLVTVFGPSLSKMLFPVGYMVKYARIMPFERLDAIFLPTWIMDTLLSLTAYVYFASQCIISMGVKRYRRTLIVVLTVIAFLLGIVSSKRHAQMLSFFISPVISVCAVVGLLLIPLLILTVDSVKRKVAKNNEKGA